MKLTLIRHGLTEGNIRRLYYGAMDLPLLPDGIEALHALRDGGGYPEAEQYFTSGMTRTEQTFAALYGDRPHGTLPGMQEMRFGEFEGKTYADLKDDPAFRAWCSGDYENNVCPGGESWNGLTDRALQALAPSLAQGKVAPRQQGIADVHIAVEMQKARDEPRRSGQQHRPQRRRAAEALQQPCHRRPHEPDYAARERQAGDHVRPRLLVPDAARARNGQKHAP